MMQTLVFHFPFASSPSTPPAAALRINFRLLPEVETPIRRVLPMGISTSLDANGCGE
jgi:hypothetical protein